MSRAGDILWPVLFGVAVLALWEFAVRWWQVPVFLLPPPSAIATAFVRDAALLADAWLHTIRLTLASFFACLAGGMLLAVLFTRDRRIERVFRPYAVMLQVTPIVAIAPLVVVWVGLDHVERAVFVLATIAGFFPVLANATLGLRQVDPGLDDLFRLYGATPPQRLLRLELPSALPAILTGAKISAGLALIGTVVAEFVAGSGEATGLAWRILESGNRLEIPRMFASLVLLAATGVGLHALLAAVEARLLVRRRGATVG